MESRFDRLGAGRASDRLREFVAGSLIAVGAVWIGFLLLLWAVVPRRVSDGSSLSSPRYRIESSASAVLLTADALNSVRGVDGYGETSSASVRVTGQHVSVISGSGSDLRRLLVADSIDRISALDALRYASRRPFEAVKSPRPAIPGARAAGAVVPVQLWDGAIAIVRDDRRSGIVADVSVTLEIAPETRDRGMLLLLSPGAVLITLGAAVGLRRRCRRLLDRDSASAPPGEADGLDP